MKVLLEHWFNWRFTCAGQDITAEVFVRQLKLHFIVTKGQRIMEIQREDEDDEEVKEAVGREPEKKKKKRKASTERRPTKAARSLSSPLSKRKLPSCWVLVRLTQKREQLTVAVAKEHRGVWT